MKNNDESLWRKFLWAVDDVEDSIDNLLSSSQLLFLLYEPWIPHCSSSEREHYLKGILYWLLFSLLREEMFPVSLCFTLSATCLHNTSNLFYKCSTSVFFCVFRSQWRIFITFSYSEVFFYILGGLKNSGKVLVKLPRLSNLLE